MIVWLSSFPRSGNTFLRTLLKSCFGQDTFSIYNDNDIGGDPALTDLTGHKALKYPVDSPNFDLTSFRETEDPIFLKTHEPTRALVEEGDKVIYVVRDGREAMLSFQRYLKNFHNKPVPWLDLQLGLEFPGKTWGEHVEGWSPETHDDTLLLFFEEMVGTPRTAIDQISTFVDLPVLKYSAPTFDELNAANSRFFNKGKTDSFDEKLTADEKTSFLLTGVNELIQLEYETADSGLLHGVPHHSLQSASRICREAIERLRSRIEESNKMVAIKSAALEKLAVDMKAQHERAAQQEHEIDQLTLQAAGLNQDISNLHRKVADLESAAQLNGAKIESLNAELESTTQRDRAIIESLNTDLERQRSQIVAIHNTLSWKVTSPLRAIRKLFSPG